MGIQVTSRVATLPKPQYPSRPAVPELLPVSGVRAVRSKDSVVSASSSLLGLQAQSPPLAAEPCSPEPGVLAFFFRWRQNLRHLLRWLAQRWLAADFKWCQLPVLVLALGVWAMTARSAWTREESATPLLLESISQIHRAQARAALNLAVPAAPKVASQPRPTVTPVAGNSGPAASPQVTQSAPPAEAISGRAEKVSENVAKLLAASIRSWFSTDPAPAEKVKGNPRLHVWVDLKTGLYYCPGADYYGYGGRERGKVMSQKNAEFEYFQPAAGAPCQ